MTNAQAALIAAASFLQGNGKAQAQHVEAMAARFTEWLAVEDEGAQEATSAPQADEPVDGERKARCADCGRTIRLTPGGMWRDTLGWPSDEHGRRHHP